MFCPNCGKQLPEGSRFCDSCGTKVADVDVPESTLSATEEASAAGEAPVAEEAPAAETAPAENTAPVASEASAAPAAPTVETANPAGAAAPVTPAQPNAVQPKKKGGKAGLYAIIGVAAVVLIAIIVGAVSLLSSSGSSSNAYAYISDGKFELIKNLKKGDPIEIASSRSGYTYGSMLQFSPDGKYVYYYTKLESSSGTLCRAEYAKLKDNSSKNDKYIETIATNVALGFTFIDDSTVIYRTGSDVLYYYDGKESNKIASSVSSYYTDGSQYVVYTTGSYSDYAIYGVDLKDVDNKIKLASGCYSTYIEEDFENIYYTKIDEEYNETLYVVGINKSAEKIGDEVDVIDVSDGIIYFASSKGGSVSYYDYVTDEYKSADEGLTEPDREDFGTPVYAYRTIGAYNDPNNYEELYASCSRRTSLANNTFENLTESARSDVIRAKYQEFVDKYKSQENEDGYFLVTDSVRSDLTDLAKTVGYTYYDNPWLGFCFEKFMSHTEYDYDAYNEARTAYNKASQRIEVRNRLMDSEREVYTLYAYKDGKTETLGKNVISYEDHRGAILYNTTDLITEKLDMENEELKDQIYYGYDISSVFRQLFSIDYYAENYLVILGDMTANQLSGSAADTLGEANDGGDVTLYAVDGTVYMNEDNGALSMASVTDGKVNNFTLITDEAQIMGTKNSVLYYASDSYTSNNLRYGDVYSYSKGKSERLAQDVIVNAVQLYDDGVIIAFTGYRNNHGFEVEMISAKGDATYIADDISLLIRVDKNTLLYISGDDLYYFNGKDKSMVAEDVDWVWSMNDMSSNSTTLTINY